MRAQTAIQDYLAAIERAGASRPTRRQREWALNQTVTAAALRTIHGQEPTQEHVLATPPARVAFVSASVDVTEILSPDFAAWFLPWAATGILGQTKGAAQSQASSRARVAALRALALHLDQTPITHIDPAVALRTPTPMNARALRHVAFDLVLADAPSKAAVRLSAMLAVMITTPLRPVDLCDLTVGDIHSEPDGRVSVPPLPDEQGPAWIDPALGELVRRWLLVRSELVSRLEGDPPESLWVSVRASPTDEGVILPAGLPLHPRGLERSYVGQARNYNAELNAGSRTALPLGRDGVPVSHLPLSFDHLRRSLETLEDSEDLRS